MASLALALLTLASLQPAEAGRGGRGGGGGGNTADLAISMSLPTFDVEVSDTVTVTVDNNGRRDAKDVSIAIALPETATSPTTHVMGLVSNVDSACWEDGTLIKCIVGTVAAGSSTSVSFDIALPESANDLEFYASTGSSTSDANTADNETDDIATVLYPDLVISSAVDVVNRHCTGTDLSAFFECELYPSSISSHPITLESDNSVTIGAAGYTGSWSQPSDDTLWFEYVYAGQQRLEFFGHAVDGDCFEGLSIFPGTGYVAPYEVCIQ